MNQPPGLPGEFELIARYFAPLAEGFPGAYGLLDDAAVIASLPGHELVAKTEAIVGDVHFLLNDAPDLIARKALRVNLSDLAAKGANRRVTGSCVGNVAALLHPKSTSAPRFMQRVLRCGEFRITSAGFVTSIGTRCSIFQH